MAHIWVTLAFYTKYGKKINCKAANAVHHADILVTHYLSTLLFNNAIEG